jgi:hypothetical protein
MLSATKKSRRCFSRVAKQKTKPPDLCPLAIRAAIAILFSPLFRRPDFEKNFAAKSSRLSSTPRFRAASIKRLNCAGSVLFARFFSCLPLPRPLVQYRQGQRTGKPGGSRGTLGKSPRPHHQYRLTIVGSVAFARALRQSPSRPSSRCCAGCSPKRAALFCCFGGDAKGRP